MRAGPLVAVGLLALLLTGCGGSSTNVRGRDAHFVTVIPHGFVNAGASAPSDVLYRAVVPHTGNHSSRTSSSAARHSTTTGSSSRAS